jgi:hypothetical protein
MTNLIKKNKRKSFGNKRKSFGNKRRTSVRRNVLKKSPRGPKKGRKFGVSEEEVINLINKSANKKWLATRFSEPYFWPGGMEIIVPHDKEQASNQGLCAEYLAGEDGEINCGVTWRNRLTLILLSLSFFFLLFPFIIIIYLIGEELAKGNTNTGSVEFTSDMTKLYAAAGLYGIAFIINLVYLGMVASKRSGIFWHYATPPYNVYGTGDARFNKLNKEVTPWQKRILRDLNDDYTYLPASRKEPFLNVKYDKGHADDAQDFLKGSEKKAAEWVAKLDAKKKKWETSKSSIIDKDGFWKKGNCGECAQRVNCSTQFNCEVTGGIFVTMAILTITASVLVLYENDISKKNESWDALGYLGIISSIIWVLFGAFMIFLGKFCPSGSEFGETRANVLFTKHFTKIWNGIWIFIMVIGYGSCIAGSVMNYMNVANQDLNLVLMIVGGLLSSGLTVSFGLPAMGRGGLMGIGIIIGLICSIGGIVAGIIGGFGYNSPDLGDLKIPDSDDIIRPALLGGGFSLAALGMGMVVIIYLRYSASLQDELRSGFRL